MQDKILKLTNAVYKLLEFFPESDPLKNRAKDKALAIMENLVSVNEISGWASFNKEKIKVQIYEDIDTLLGYLWIAKSQGWLNSANCLILANEYEKIRKGIEPAGTAAIPAKRDLGVETTRSEQPSVSVLKGESDRQRQILEFLGKNEKAQVMDLQTILPDITKRTIRRDLDELLEMGKIIRLGDFNRVFYRLVG
jgi:DNA-binding transcriptional ArsR family regulator